MKCGTDEILKLVQDSPEENISRESFDKTLQSLIDSEKNSYQKMLLIETLLT